MPKDIKKMVPDTENLAAVGEATGTDYSQPKTGAQTIMVFSAELQKDVPHTIDIDGNGEIVLTDTLTGRFLKFPKGTDASELKAGLVAHKFQNEGQLTVEAVEQEKSKLIEELLADGTLTDDQES